MFEQGKYLVRARRWDFVESERNNHVQFEMWFDVLGRVDGDDPDQLQPCEPGVGSWSITLNSPGNAVWLASTVLNLGYDREDLLGLDPDEPGAFNFQGIEFNASCNYREYNDREYEQWSVVRPRKKTASKDRLRGVLRQYEDAIREVKARRAAKSTGSETDRGDDGVTF
jgi:hypothetical protein